MHFGLDRRRIHATHNIVDALRFGSISICKRGMIIIYYSCETNHRCVCSCSYYIYIYIFCLSIHFMAFQHSFFIFSILCSYFVIRSLRSSVAAACGVSCAQRARWCLSAGREYKTILRSPSAPLLTMAFNAFLISDESGLDAFAL